MFHICVAGSAGLGEELNVGPQAALKQIYRLRLYASLHHARPPKWAKVRPVAGHVPPDGDLVPRGERGREADGQCVRRGAFSSLLPRFQGQNARKFASDRLL